MLIATACIRRMQYGIQSGYGVTPGHQHSTFWDICGKSVCKYDLHLSPTHIGVHLSYHARSTCQIVLYLSDFRATGGQAVSTES